MPTAYMLMFSFVQSRDHPKIVASNKHPGGILLRPRGAAAGGSLREHEARDEVAREAWAMSHEP